MSRQLQHDGKRSKRSPVWSGEADGASGITMNASNEPQDQRLYIIRGHPEDGDYLRAIERLFTDSASLWVVNESPIDPASCAARSGNRPGLDAVGLAWTWLRVMVFVSFLAGAVGAVWWWLHRV